MNPEFPHLSREGLEAQITALLLGELPAEDAAAVEAALAADPALARLRDRLRHTIGLVREASALPNPAPGAEAQPAHLSPERREQLLQRFKLPTPAQMGVPAITSPPKRRRWLPLVSRLAALAAVVCLVGLLLLPALQSAKHKGPGPASRSLRDRFTVLSRMDEPPALTAPPAPAAGSGRESSAEGRESETASPRPSTLGSRLSSAAPAERSKGVALYLPSGGQATPAEVPLLMTESRSDPDAIRATSNQRQINLALGASGADEDGRRQYSYDLSDRLAEVPAASTRGQAENFGVVWDLGHKVDPSLGKPAAARMETEALAAPALQAAGEGGFRRFGVNEAGVAATADAPVGGLAGGAFGDRGGHAGLGTVVAGDAVVGSWDNSDGAKALGEVRANEVPASAAPPPGGPAPTSPAPVPPPAAIHFAADLPPPTAAPTPATPESRERFMRRYGLSPSARPAAPAETVRPWAAGTVGGGLADAVTDLSAEAQKYQWNAPAKLAGRRSVATPELGDAPVVGQAFHNGSQAPQDTSALAFGRDAKAESLARAHLGAAPSRATENFFAEFDADASVLAPARAGGGEGREALRQQLATPTQPPSKDATTVYSVSGVGFANRSESSSTPLSRGLEAAPAQAGTMLFEDISQPAEVRHGGQPALATNARHAGGFEFRGLAEGDSVAAPMSGITVAGAAREAKEAGAVRVPVDELARADKVERLARLDQEKAAAVAEAKAKERIAELAKQVEAAAPAVVPSEPPAPPKPATPPPVPQPEVPTAENAFSTFSLNVSDVSFKLAAASLEKGVLPDAAAIRSEEFINAFDYRDPEPTGGAPVAFAWERARYPFAHNRDLLRFSVKTAAAGREAGRPLNLVLLLDNSGSMERADRVSIIREALHVLAVTLTPRDKLSVVTFSRTARLWVDGVSGKDAGAVAERISQLTPQGGTNLEEAMKAGYEAALRHYIAGGLNRVVLLTDGAANLGNLNPDALKAKVEAHRKQGIALDCFGIGWEGYNDDLLEVLSRNGDGRYGFLNSPEAAATQFAAQLAGALKVAASDVKVQVEFNPARVTTYRQIGYAKHQLKQEQFRDNTVDAAELGAAEAGNALYTVETNPRGDGPVATVRVRFKKPGTADYQEREWVVPYTGAAAPLEITSPAMRLAAGAAAFSEWLAGSPFAGEVTPDRVLGCLAGVPAVYGADERPKQLEWMVRQARSIAGK